MKAQEIMFAVQEENGIVTKIGKSVYISRKTACKGSVKWHQDVSRTDTRQKG